MLMNKSLLMIAMLIWGLWLWSQSSQRTATMVAVLY